ncbi:MAG: glycosyltransferase [Spirochaetes bacterium]|jgi:glycosyltransferase involved in cell wall biosynthesis|nr:glycosyltransferase [Spirochaetota bacterium]
MSVERIAFLGGFVPRLCGIATFTSDICEAVATASPASEVYACAVNDLAQGYDYPSRVRFELAEQSLDSYRRVADLLNFSKADVLCVQHEFGIYGGQAGSHLIALLKEVRMPVVTTLHTILGNPDPAQRNVMDELIRRSDRLIVMAEKGREILTDTYGVSEQQIELIPHGIPDMPFVDSESYKIQFGVEGREVLFTFGLLGPGKGIEYVIEALPAIIARHPKAIYLILGATHPHLVATNGESYRLGLERLAEEKGVRDHVIFYNRFVSLEELKEFIGATDVYLTPYLNEAQITSGTLAYVFGAGKAVVSTPYWHAQELLAQGRGTLVPFRDSEAIAAGVTDYLDNPQLLDRTRREAHRIGRDMIWPAAADRYLESFRDAVAGRKVESRRVLAEWTLDGRPYDLPLLRLDHLLRMSDQTGILQHAKFDVPDFQEGYCTDDNARAFLLCCLLDETGATSSHVKLRDKESSYLSYLLAAMNRDTGRFRNFMSFTREWLEEAGSEDSHGRALWALGIGAGRAHGAGHRQLSARLLEEGIETVRTFTSPRAWAFTLIGLHYYLRYYPGAEPIMDMRQELTDRLVHAWEQCATDEWPWFEERATYENPRLSQALLLSGRSMPNARAMELGLETLGWLDSIQETQSGNFRPIGSNGFYARGGERADFDQQPVEAQAMVSACLAAFRATGDRRWWHGARRSFEWFLGRNDLGLSLYDPATGGCADGLHVDRVNENQGAESTLAFHLSLAEMKLAELPVAVDKGKQT